MFWKVGNLLDLREAPESPSSLEETRKEKMIDVPKTMLQASCLLAKHSFSQIKISNLHINVHLSQFQNAFKGIPFRF